MIEQPGSSCWEYNSFFQKIISEIQFYMVKALGGAFGGKSAKEYLLYSNRPYFAAMGEFMIPSTAVLVHQGMLSTRTVNGDGVVSVTGCAEYLHKSQAYPHDFAGSVAELFMHNRHHYQPKDSAVFTQPCSVHAARESLRMTESDDPWEMAQLDTVMAHIRASR